MRKKVIFVNDELSRKHDSYLSIFRNIGSNWNQIARSYNSACAKKRADGSPVVNTGRTRMVFNQMSAVMDEIISLQKEIKKVVERQLSISWEEKTDR